MNLSALKCLDHGVEWGSVMCHSDLPDMWMLLWWSGGSIRVRGGRGMGAVGKLSWSSFEDRLWGNASY